MKNHNPSENQEDAPADNFAVFGITAGNTGVERQNGKTENDQIIQHKKEIVNQDIAIMLER